MRRYIAWGLMALGLASVACTQLPFFNSETSTTSQPAVKTPTPNRDPIIRSLTAHHFENATSSVALWVQAFDPDCDDQRVSWSVTEGVLSSTVGTDVTLMPTATRSAPYVITAQVSVSDGRGGTAQGSLNVQVGPDGVPTMATEATASPPTPEPCVPTPTKPDLAPPAPDSTPTSMQPPANTFFVSLTGGQIVVQPKALVVAGSQKVYFKALSGDWQVNSVDQWAYPGVDRDLRSGASLEFPVWQLFDPTTPPAIGSQMRFLVYRAVPYGGYLTRSGSPVVVTASPQ